MIGEVRFPARYQHPFHENRTYLGRETRIEPTRLVSGGLRLDSDSALLKGRLLSEFDRARYERSGILQGEFIVLPGRRLLLDPRLRHDLCPPGPGG